MFMLMNEEQKVLKLSNQICFLSYTLGNKVISTKSIGNVINLIGLFLFHHNEYVKVQNLSEDN